MAADAFDRHDLVSVLEDGADPLPDTVPGPARRAWEAAGRPLIRRRGAAAGDVPLGLPLPPAMGKARIALWLPPERLAARPTPALGAAAVRAPACWQATLARAQELARDHGVRVSPYGALLWEALLGLPYLHADSDLDLLWRCPGGVPAGLLADLSHLAARAPMRIDGEVVVDGHGVQWRELAAADHGDAVLCRHRAGVGMRAAAAFRSPCPA